MTLFHLAAHHLGDATRWTRIAAINKIRDPFLSVTTVLEIPSLTAPKGQGSVI